jgi:6-phosphofructokinase 2
VPNEKTRCEAPLYDAGGGGINVARALKQLGGDPLAIFPCGGPSGAVITGLLRQAGVAHQAIPIEGSIREDLHITDRSTGAQYQFVMKGPTLSEDEQIRCLDALSTMVAKPEFVVVSGSLPPGVQADFYPQVESITSRLGAKLVIDASGIALRQAGKGIYLLKMSLTELEDFVGHSLDEEDSQEDAVQAMLDEGRAEIIVVSLGKNGALVANRDGHWRLPAIPVIIRSTVGAGDSMVAGIVMALTRGWSLLDAVRYGIIAATAALMWPGTQLCKLADVHRLSIGYSPVARVRRCTAGLTSSLALSS